ncbi:MAG TPA: hypothetical protein VGA70_00550 [Longimicrobiales bacterium]
MEDAKHGPGPATATVSKSTAGWTRAVWGGLAAMTPFVGYAVAWFHEWGYALYFGYPVELVQVDFRVLLSFWSLTVFGLLGIATAFMMLTYFVPWRPVWILLQGGLFLSPLLFTVWVFQLMEFTSITGLIVSTAFTAVLGLFLALLFHRRFLAVSKGGLIQRLQEGLKQERKLVDAEQPICDSSIEAALKRDDPVGILSMLALATMWLVYASLLGVRAYGQYAAGDQQEFPVAVQQPLVAVRSYGSHVIAFELDQATNQVTRRYRVLPELNDFTWVVRPVSTRGSLND